MVEHKERPPHLIAEVASSPRLRRTTMDLNQIYRLAVWTEEVNRHIARMERDKGLTMPQRWDRDDKELIEQRDAEIGWQGREIKRT